MFNRRRFIQTGLSLIAGSMLPLGAETTRGKIAITIDDPHTGDTPLLSWQERHQAIIQHLHSHTIKAMLFVCGKRIDHAEGNTLLHQWEDSGHFLGNHSYSHMYYHSSKVTSSHFIQDIEKCNTLLTPHKGFRKFFRYPFLKEGNTIEKRDAIRTYLKNTATRNGTVSVDASDWYVDQRMTAALKKDPKTNLAPYLNFYISHIKDRVQYYDTLSLQCFERPISHTLLIHHSLLNALFLGHLLSALKKDGWNLIDADTAFTDPVHSRQPDIIPAGESIVWGCAKETGKYEKQLRYPGEDSAYEKDTMDALKL